MPSPWAGLAVGGPILADSYFSNGFEADFSKPLDGGSNADGILGTTPGHQGDPFNFTYPTDGQFKVGGHLQFHQNYATGYQYPYASDQRNKEPNHYVHFHGGDNPDPMSFFEIRNGKLVLKARQVTDPEQSWARIKGFAIQENGIEATYDWFAANGGVPADWAPDSLTGAGTQPVYFRNMPARYASTMISTYNRCSMSFGRSMARVMMPFGAKANGSTTDLNNIEAWFPAFWDLEDVPALCDLNGRAITSETVTPGNPGAHGILTELDQIELFGYEPNIHITSHMYTEGKEGYFTSVGPTQLRRVNHDQVNHTPPYPAVSAVRGQFLEVGVDRFPSYGTEPGKIVFHINGVIHAIRDMPAYIADPKIMYDPYSSVSYLPQLNGDWTVKRLGSQVYEDGNPAYAHFCQIFNIGMSAGFVRSQAASNLDNGTAPSFAEQEEMQIEWTVMKPLIDENPDTKPFIDYKAGDFGGSSSTQVGPVINSGTVGEGATGYTPPVTTPTTPVTPTGDNPYFMDGQRYDETQGEVTWNQSGYTEFEVYRNGVLQQPSPNNGSSLYQNDLVAGTLYTYAVYAKDSNGDDVAFGTVDLPGAAGAGVFTLPVTVPTPTPTTPSTDTEFHSYEKVIDRPNGGCVFVPEAREDLA